MNRISPQDKVCGLPIRFANDYWSAVEMAERIAGYESTRESAVKTAYLDGFRRGVEAAGKGELMEENDALHNAFLELDLGERQTIALRELLADVLLETTFHEDDCQCGLCQAVRKYEEAKR